MISSHRPVALALVATLLVSTSGCNDTRADAPTTHMSPSQAQQALIDSLNHSMIGPVSNVAFAHNKVSFVGKGKSHNEPAKTDLYFIAKNDCQEDDEMGFWGFYVWGYTVTSEYPKAHTTKFRWTVEEKASVTRFCDAMRSLEEAACAPDAKETVDFDAFQAGAKAWQAMNPKPEMSDDARTFRVMAEDAFKRKEYTTALDNFGFALDRFPMWPEGQYNAALLAAEAEDYELAAKHMRRYLVLSPDATDSAAAKDKLLLWQHKASEDAKNAWALCQATLPPPAEEAAPEPIAPARSTMKGSGYR